MTTKNLQGIDALREAIAASADGVRARAQEVIVKDDAIKASIESEEERALRDATDAAIVARLLQQQHSDTISDLKKDREVLSEEGAQLASILAGTSATVPAPITSVVLVESEPDGALQEPAKDDSAPTESISVMTNAKQSPVSDPREWGWLAWGLAALGILAGLIIADVTNVDEWVRLHGSGLIGWIFTILWWVGWPMFLGGWFGYLGSRRELKNRHA